MVQNDLMMNRKVDGWVPVPVPPVSVTEAEFLCDELDSVEPSISLNKQTR